MTDVPEEELPEKPCAFCAGTGKVRDYKMSSSPFAAGTYHTIDPLVLDGLSIYPIAGT